MSNHRTLLLSLRPRFAEAILSGQKSIEIRRRPISAPPGTPIIFYASSPVMAVVGTARLAYIEALAPHAAWRRHRDAVGLTRSEYDAYLEGADQAYLLHLRRVSSLTEPLALSYLRQEGPFQPPQSFRYVAASDPGQLKELVST